MVAAPIFFLAAQFDEDNILSPRVETPLHKETAVSTAPVFSSRFHAVSVVPNEVLD
jgi:hypothetical protein